MNTFSHKDNHGALFINDRKTSDTQPDRRGTAMVGGREYKLSGWLRKNTKGMTFLSLSFTPEDGDDPKPSQTDEIDW